jgi:hypothetical protein
MKSPFWSLTKAQGLFCWLESMKVPVTSPHNRPGRYPVDIPDALAGSVGLVGALIVIGLLPWPRNTIAYNLPSGVHVTSTMNMYQYPLRIAYTAAFILPFLLELDRFRLSGKQR